jgi:predicted esterase
MILTHGRGASAEDILGLAAELAVPGFAYVAPQAAGHTWYPYSFLAPMADNEPGLSSGLATLGAIVAALVEAGLPPERTILLGFSQGACLTTEFVARNARRYGGVAGLSGGLIGPPGTPRDYAGGLEGTPVFLGCSDIDPHIPLARVEETATVFEQMGGAVTAHIYPRMGHTINRDEIAQVQAMMRALISGELR